MHVKKRCNPFEDNKISEFNQNLKPDKAPFITYEVLEIFLEKTDGPKNNPKNSSILKVGEYIPSGFVMPTISSFKNMGNKHDLYTGKDYMKKFYESLREDAIETIN